MFEKIADKILNKQILNGSIHVEEASVYKYGYIVALEMLCNILLGLLIGFVSDSVISVLLFWIFFIPLRSFSGGWHASKTWQCILVSNLVLIIVIVLLKIPFAQMNFMFLRIFQDIQWQTRKYCVIFEMLCVAMIVLLAPVDVESKRLSRHEKRSYKMKAAFIVCLEFGLCLLLKKISGLIFLTHIIMVISLVMQLIKNKIKERKQ